MPRDLDGYTDAELRQLLAATNSMTTYRAVRRLLDRRAQERAAKRRAEREQA